MTPRIITRTTDTSGSAPPESQRGTDMNKSVIARVRQHSGFGVPINRPCDLENCQFRPVNREHRAKSLSNDLST